MGQPGEGLNEDYRQLPGVFRQNLVTAYRTPKPAIAVLHNLTQASSGARSHLVANTNCPLPRESSFDCQLRGKVSGSLNPKGVDRFIARQE